MIVLTVCRRPRPILVRGDHPRRCDARMMAVTPVLLLPPCGCRSISFRLGQARGGNPPRTPEIDAVLHEERLDCGRQRVHAIIGPFGELPPAGVIPRSCGKSAFVILATVGSTGNLRWNKSQWMRRAESDIRTCAARAPWVRCKADLFYGSPTWKSPGWDGAIGVNKPRSGLRSSNGVPFRQSRPRTVTTEPSTPTS